MHEDDPLQLLADLVTDVEACLAWQALCGAQLLPIGGPDLPPPPEPPAPAAPDFRPPPPQRTAPPRPKTPSRPTTKPTAKPAVKPAAPAAKPAVSRKLTGAWARVVEAPREEQTGAAALKALADRIGPGKICGSCQNALQHTRGQGTSPVLVVSGEPLVPDASRMLAAMIKNVLKIEPSGVFAVQVNHRCRSFFRPGQGELPRDCGHLLRSQLGLMKPRVMMVLGREASRALLAPQRLQIGRGRWVDYRTADGVLPALMTYHPNFLVQNPDHKRHAFEDLKLFRARMVAEQL
jgi:uracil-DNA glycosylase family 4